MDVAIGLSPAPGPVPALAVRDVWVHPPGASHASLRGVSLDVAAGEWLAVTGANGCGKTSLALAVAGLWPVARGTVQLNGQAVRPDRPDSRRRIAAVLQDPASQILHSTVAKELAFAVSNLGAGERVAEDGAREWARRLDLEPALDRDPATLSAGEKQRVLVAAALATRPDLLVLDEASAHMDAVARAAVMRAVRAETRRGMAVLWVTQEAEEVANADRRLDLVNGGRAADPDRPTDSAEGPAAPGPAPPDPRAPQTTRAAAGSVAMTIRIAANRPLAGPAVSVERAVEWELRPGSPVVLLGPNGSGKSVILERAAGLIEARQVACVADEGVAHAPILAGQHPELHVFGGTVEEELVWAAVHRGAPRAGARAEAIRLLQALGLPRDLLGRRSWEISSGERRMVHVVSALVAPAGLLLLDEPTCGLDPGRRQTMIAIVASRTRATASLIATQDDTWTRIAGVRIERLGRDPQSVASPSKKTD